MFCHASPSARASTDAPFEEPALDELHPSDLKTVPHSKRANFYYLEHCRVLVNGGRVEYVTDEGKRSLYWNIPIANTTTALLSCHPIPLDPLLPNLCESAPGQAACRNAASSCMDSSSFCLAALAQPCQRGAGRSPAACSPTMGTSWRTHRDLQHLVQRLGRRSWMLRPGCRPVVPVRRCHANRARQRLQSHRLLLCFDHGPQLRSQSDGPRDLSGCGHRQRADHLLSRPDLAL